MQSVTVIGKRWFDKVNGNTYNSVQILVDGKFYKALEWSYGYDYYFEQRAIEQLIKDDLITSKRDMLDSGVNYEVIVSDGLKRDMVAFGKRKV